MNNFCRALRLALRHRKMLCYSLVTSLLIAVLWGGNIGALYPIFSIVLEGKSLQSWMDEEIDQDHREVARLGSELADLHRQVITDPEQKKKIARETDIRNARLAAVQRDLQVSKLVRPWIDHLPRDPFLTVVMIVLALMIATVIKDACIVANLVAVAKLIQQVGVDLQQQVYEHVLCSDLRMLSRRGTSSLLSHMTNDVAQVGGGLSNVFGGAVREPLKMVACLIGAMYICWRLLALSMFLIPIAALLTHFLGKSLKRANRRWLEHYEDVNRQILESFNGIATVQAYTMEEFEQKRFAEKMANTVRKSIRIVWYAALTKPATEVLGIGVVSISLLSGAYLVLNQETHLFGISVCDRPLSLQDLLVFYGLLIGASDPARRLSEVFSGIQGGVAAADRLYPLLDERPTIVDPPSPRTTTKPHRQLVFEGVSFRYNDNRPVLENIDLVIEFGETVAIVGPNGCGKTTLTNLIPRFYDPTSGVVRLDDVPLSEMRLADLRKRIGVVSQQAVLFDESVHHNIAYGSPGATRENVIAAAQQAYAHSFIEERLEASYDTRVGQNGHRLSGGQRQRIALARAILRDPEILILDEATSQIDIESEHLIHRVLERFVQGRTTIMVTHRLSTLELANRIIVMDGGQIRDMGKHGELMARCEVYRKLHDFQIRRGA